MSVEAFVARLVKALEEAGIPYMITGSFASSAHGVVRSTRDVDVVIAATEEQLRLFIAQFPNDQYYADEYDAVDALRHQSQFNIIDFATRARMGESERQIDDAAGILATQGAHLDHAYVEQWVRELGLDEQWRRARERAG